MKGLWEKQFGEDENHIEIPREIVQSQCEILANMTNEKIIGRITVYDGDVKSYTINPIRFALNSPFIEKSFDIQSVLGEVDEDKIIAYEFYLSSLKTPKYRYRAFIIYHSIMIYPVNFIIERSIADELEMPEEVSASNAEEFRGILGKILNSEKITNIINSLLVLNKDY